MEISNNFMQDTQNYESNDKKLFTQEEVNYLQEQNPKTQNKANIDALEEEQLTKNQTVEAEAEEVVSKKNKTVPHGAFHEEREERKKAQAKLRDIKSQLSQLHKVMQDYVHENQGFSNAERKDQALDQLPDPEQDPTAFMNYLAKQQQKLLQKEEQKFIDKVSQEQDQAIQNYLKTCIEETQNTYPDFFDASNYLYAQRHKQLKSLGSIYKNLQNEADIDEYIGLELRQLVESAIQNEQDPTKIIYDFAMSMGYESRKIEESESIAQGLEDLDVKTKAAKTLAARNGKNSADPYSLEAIYAMSEDDFGIWISKAENEQIFKKLMTQL